MQSVDLLLTSTAHEAVTLRSPKNREQPHEDAMYIIMNQQKCLLCAAWCYTSCKLF